MKKIVLVLLIIAITAFWIKHKDVVIEKHIENIDAIISFSEGYSFYGILDKSSSDNISASINWGIIDANGTKITGDVFEYHSNFNEGLAKISYKEQAFTYGYVDTKGNITIEPDYLHATAFQNGFAAVSRDKLKYGYIDKNNTFVIEPKFDGAKPFNENYATVKKGKKWGYIDVNGTFVIPPKFDEAFSFNNGIAYVKEEEVNKIIDINGNTVLDRIKVLAISKENRLLIEKNNEILLINSEGKTLKNISEYDIAFDSDEFVIADEMIVFKANDTYGYMDLSGKIVINNSFEHAEPFSNGFAVIKSNNKYGYINKKGKVVVKPKYFIAFPVAENYIASAYGNNRDIYILSFKN